MSSAEPYVVAVLAPFPVDPSLQEQLREHVPTAEVRRGTYSESRDARGARGANNGKLPHGLEAPQVSDQDREALRDARLLICLDMPPDLGALAPNLEWVQTISAGVDHVDTEMLAAMGVRLASASGIASASIAEFVMARLLEVWKNLRHFETIQRDEQWHEAFGTEVGGKTLLMAGLGSIGREVARRARAFDMRVIATRGSAKPGDTDPAVDELHPASALDELLPHADAVVCALPSSPATTDMFNRARFELMKSDAIFCNVGRGTLVVEEDLVAMLQAGHLRAAILDVMRTEPPPPGDPLWTAPNMYLSPHSAVSLDRYMENGWKISADNLRRFSAGERLNNEVTL